MFSALQDHHDYKLLTFPLWTAFLALVMELHWNFPFHASSPAGFTNASVGFPQFLPSSPQASLLLLWHFDYPPWLLGATAATVIALFSSFHLPIL